MDNPKRIDFNNPRIDFKGTSFDKYVISKPINHFSIIITRLSPIFKPWKNQDVSEIKFEGCLLKYPVCELPKFGLLKKFYSILQNHFTLSIHTTKKNEEIDSQYLNKISSINKKFNTNYFFSPPSRILPCIRDLNYGTVNFYNPNYYGNNHISINHSNEKYLNFFYDNVVNSDIVIKLDIAFQKIEEWEFESTGNYLYPIIEMNIDRWDFREIIEGDNFNLSSLSKFPQGNILVKK